MQLELRKTIISSENIQSQIILFEAFIASKVIATLTSVEDLFLKHAYFDWQKRLGGAVTSHARTYARSVPLVLPRVPTSCHLYTQRSHLVLFRYRNISKHHIVCIITVNQLLYPLEVTKFRELSSVQIFLTMTQSSNFSGKLLSR